MDYYVGEIIDKLDRLGLLENTIIIFSSDNGAHREGGADPDFFNSTAGFRGYKRDLYEGGIRTPLLVSWKGHIPAGTTTEHIGAFWDILPTVQDLTKHGRREQTDGISLLPSLLNQGRQQKHKHLYWEFHEDGGRQAVRYKNYKLIKFKVKDPENSYYELYDLKRDPQEKKPVQNTKLAKKMLKLIEEQHSESEIFPLLKKNTQ